MKALSVKCHGEYCKWTGTVGTVAEHEAKCGLFPVPCPNNCYSWIEHDVHYCERRALNKHLKFECPNRDFYCKYCGEEGTYRSIQLCHEYSCEKKVITCPKDGCSEKMKRKHLAKHLRTDCQHAVISCKYVSIGCDERMKRQDMEAHELDYASHLGVALDTINLLREERRNTEPIKLKISDYKIKKDNNEHIQSPFLYTSPTGYRVSFGVDVNGHAAGKGTHVSVVAAFLEGRYNAELSWPFIGKITFTLLNQLEDKNHREHVVDLKAVDRTRVGSRKGKAQFISHLALEERDASKKIQYLKDDTLYFRMLVEPVVQKPWLE